MQEISTSRGEAFVSNTALLNFPRINHGDFDFGMMTILKSLGAPILGSFYLYPSDDYDWEMIAEPLRNGVTFKWTKKMRK